MLVSKKKIKPKYDTRYGTPKATCVDIVYMSGSKNKTALMAILWIWIQADRTLFGRV
jgi:hypothetical protein